MRKAKPDKKKIPKHVAIIMDGNRRWAARRGLGPVDGHRQAAEKNLLPLVEKAIELGVPYITLWAFSTENKKRDKEELKGLFDIFRKGLKKDIEDLQKRKVKVNILGEIDWFPRDIARLAKEAVKKTAKNNTITVSFALNYGGREEIIRAIKKLAKNGENIRNLTEEEFSSYLDTAEMPDPDLIIRTGGEKRLSGFLPWQATYAELYFTKVLFPDFSPSKFEKAIVDYQSRARRFGGGSIRDYKRSS